MLRSALLVLSGNAAASALLLARNLLVARLIPVEDYGVAATFAIAMAVVEMASQLGLKQQIVQAREGEDPHFQAALQGFQVLRGAISGVVLFLAAGAIAGFLGIPHVAWAYQVLALVPVLHALQHFDIHRLNRGMRFGPMLWTGVLPALASLAAILPLVAAFGDWRAMLWALMIQAGLGAAVSHLMAERPYRLAFDPAIMGRSLRFGWPLLLNGVLLFAVFQGDKLIVGRELGMAALGVFAMGVTLTLTPTLVMAKSAQNLFLPRLSRAAAGRGTDPAPFAAEAQAMLQAALLNGSALVLGAALLGAPVVALLLGAKYAALAPLMTWFGVLHGLRVLKSGPAVIALSCGHTANATIANGVRVAALPLAWWAVAGGGGLGAVLGIGIAAEAAGFALALWLVRHRLGLAFGPSAPALALSALLMAAAVLGAGPAPWATWAVPPLFLALLAAMGDLRGALRRRGRATEPTE